jgi:hypothetical protein
MTRPSHDRLARSLEAAPVDQVRESMGSLLPSRAPQGQESSEDGLRLLERSIDFPAETPVPADRCAAEPLRLPLAEKQDEL